MISTATADRAGAVQAAVWNASAATGVDFGYLLAQARIESSLDPDAKARTSSATGLFQFIEQSWLATVDKHGAAHGLGWAAEAITRGPDGRYRVADPATRHAILDLRRDPQAASAMAAEHAADNRAFLERRLGRATEPVDLYLAHFLGAGGAAKFLKAHDAAPATAAAALFPAAARSNRAVFYERDGSPRSLGEVRARFAVKLGVGAPMRFRPQQVAEQAAPPPKPMPAIAPGAHARLAYLMLASLGVSA